jgi:hypothetical protein
LKVPEISNWVGVISLGTVSRCHAFQRRRPAAGSTLTLGIVQIKAKQANEKAAQD